jgi:hypothetical protein
MIRRMTTIRERGRDAERHLRSHPARPLIAGRTSGEDDVEEHHDLTRDARRVLPANAFSPYPSAWLLVG